MLVSCMIKRCCMENAMKAYELLDSSSKWTQGTFARDSDGYSVYPTHKDAVQWCVMGALDVCYPDPNELLNKDWELGKAINSPSLAEWNDATDRTYEEVYEVLKSNNI